MILKFLLVIFIFIVTTTSHVTATADNIEEITTIEKLSPPKPLNRTLLQQNPENSFIVLINKNQPRHPNNNLYEDRRSFFLAAPSAPNYSPIEHRKDDYRKLKHARKIQEEHSRRMKEINAFMQDHYMTTLYLYQEIERILKDREVLTPLRKMVRFLETPGNEKTKDLVLKFYRKEIITANLQKEIDIWNRKPNNLVIDVMKDPYNDRVVT